MRDLITLNCESCKRKNYTTSKNKKTMTEKAHLKKFCPRVAVTRSTKRARSE
jgi:large subunit ribosomal protein L33